MDLIELTSIGEKERQAQPPVRIRCCTAAGCMSMSSQSVKQALEKAAAEGGIADRVQVVPVGCMGLCSQGPLVQVDPDGALYEQVTPEQAPAIIAEVKGDTHKELKKGDLSAPFFTKQVQIVLENSGRIDPERIEAYIAANGYQTLYKVLREMTREEVVTAVTESGLRGRGGAGYPTGLKWAMVAKAESNRKFVICNADEGDPGAFMDRSVLESDPHRVLEGMAIAAYAVGANQGYIYVRGEYPLAISRLQTAIKQAKRIGILGSQIFESPFDFKIDLRIGAGAFVCGEETALIRSIEGERGVPRPRPPYPAAEGLWGEPTLINNVESYANIAPILRNGAAWFAGIGTEKSKGTKVFALAGKIRNTGLIEVPMGTSLRMIVEEMGGLLEGGVKAVQTGGPSGGCIPANLLDTPVDYDSLAKIGSIMGSGGMIVMDDADNMVDVARFFMEFCMDESCGKCIPCRAGTVQIYRLLTRIKNGEAYAEDIAKLEQLCDMVRRTSLCGLGQSAPNPVTSTLRYFRDEYTTLLRHRTHLPMANLQGAAPSANGHGAAKPVLAAAGSGSGTNKEAQ